MKAVLALVIIYVGTFFLAIQGASQNPVSAAPQGAAAQDQASSAQTKPIDPVKDSDIRSLMELIGAHDLVQDAVNNSSEQYREKLLATVPNNDKGQVFVTSFIESYQKKFDVDQLTEQLVVIYDKHYTDDEIKTLLQFYGSPVGQKVAAEMPKITREIQAASRTTGRQGRERGPAGIESTKSRNRPIRTPEQWPSPLAAQRPRTTKRTIRPIPASGSAIRSSAILRLDFEAQI